MVLFKQSTMITPLDSFALSGFDTREVNIRTIAEKVGVIRITIDDYEAETE